MTRGDVTVLVATAGRPDLVGPCLRGIARQRVQPGQVVVVRLDDDHETEALLTSGDPGFPEHLDIRTVNERSQVVALNAGLEVATGEFVAIIDDDAVPAEDWLERMVEHFDRDPSVGGVGGRDEVVPAPREGWVERADVGIVRWYGRIIGEHHQGVGPPRRVEILKGANMAWRRSAIMPRGVGPGLRGGGAEPDNDLELSLAVRAAGWRLVYDPSITVEHRAGGKERSRDLSLRSLADVEAAAHNRSVAVHRHLSPWRRRAVSVWSGVVGTPLAPGILTALCRRSDSGRIPVRAAVAARRGWRAGRRTATAEPAPAAPLEDRRPHVALVGHDVGNVGGMEAALAAMLTHGSHAMKFTVVSRTLGAELRHLADWRRVRAPSKPFLAKFLVFGLFGGVQAARTGLPVHTCGAIVPNRVRGATVQYCHAGAREATGSLAPRSGRPRKDIVRTLTCATALVAERWVFGRHRVGRYFAVSPRVADELDCHYPGTPISIAPNGVALDRFRPDPVARTVGREELGVPPGRVVVGFVGGDWVRKGLLVVAGAIGDLRNSGHDVELWIVGDGDEDAVRQTAGGSDAVRFFGRRSDPEFVLRLCDLFAMPSDYETFSIAAFEAAAVGLPGVLTRTGATDELIDTGAAIECGRDVGSVASAIAQLIGAPDLRRTMSERATTVACRFPWSAHADAIVSVYQHDPEARP